MIMRKEQRKSHTKSCEKIQTDSKGKSHQRMAGMKAMKAVKKSMKNVMKKRAMKVSIIARNKRAKVTVFRGTKEKTASGLTKDDLMKNRAGKIVSKNKSAHGKKQYAGTIGKWVTAVQKARKSLGITGFAVVGGKTEAGQRLLKAARVFHKK